LIYKAVLNALQTHTLYKPSTIADLAVEKNLLDDTSPLARQRCRIYLAKLATCFPREGDGMIHISGQSPCPGWFGWRWQQIVDSGQPVGCTNLDKSPEAPRSKTESKGNPPSSKAGRPLKYVEILKKLDPNTLYIPACIADFAVKKRLLEDHSYSRRILRHSLAYLARSRGFPKEGDGMVSYPFQAPTVGWFGGVGKRQPNADTPARRC
jgi:hypothetical protein